MFKIVAINRRRTNALKWLSQADLCEYDRRHALHSAHGIMVFVSVVILLRFGVFVNFSFPFILLFFFFFHFPLHVCLIAYGWLLPISSIIWLNQREQLESVYCKDRKRSWPNGKYKLIPCARQLYHICLHRFGECCAVGDFWLNNMWKCLYLNALVLSLATSHANASRRLHFQ